MSTVMMLMTDPITLYSYCARYTLLITGVHAGRDRALV